MPSTPKRPIANWLSTAGLLVIALGGSFAPNVIAGDVMSWAARPENRNYYLALVFGSWVLFIFFLINALRAQKKYNDQITINTGGGAAVSGNVDTGGGDFVGRDKVITQIIQQAAGYRRGGAHMLGSINPNFEGRAEEIERILALVRKPGLRHGAIAITSLTGMGGIGKTELAHVVAHAPLRGLPRRPTGV